MGKIVHGHSRRGPKGTRRVSPEYRAWMAMKNRCFNPRQSRFKDYGERGIVVCDRWIAGNGQQSGFECFLVDIGPKPSPTHSVDRIDNDRGYEPGNVRWATKTEQARNTGATRTVDIGTGPMSLAEAIERYATASEVTVRMRIHRGWTEDDAILTPVGMPPIKAFEFPTA